MDELERRRKRAHFRAKHRGTKEMDYLLGRFADVRVSAMTADELTTFERLLVINDPDLHGWILYPERMEGSEFAGLIGEIRAFHGV